jgi:hypothetical protein
MSIQRLMLGVMVGISSFAVPAQSEDAAPGSDLKVDLAAGFFTDYMFRGFTMYDGAVVQPSIKASYDLKELGSVSASAWSSIVAESNRKANSFTEVDYTLSWTKQFGDISVSLGHIWYTYPYDKADVFPATEEFFGSVAYNTLLTPTLTVYHDYDAFDAQYYELGLSHRIESAALGEGFNVTPFAALGFASNAEKVYHDDGLVQVTTGVSSELHLGDIVVTPSLNYTFESDQNLVNNFWSGVNFAYSF